MNYLNSEQKEKLEKILNLQNNIEASMEKQDERISSYDDYLSNKVEEEKMKKMMLIKKQKDQRDKKKKLEKKMNDWAHKQEKISERQIKQYEKRNISNNNDNDKNSNNDDNEDDNEDNNNYNEEFDISKYNVISLDNMKNDESNDNNNNISNNNNDDTENNSKSNVNNEIICMICQRKFASEEKLALHEKLSELHKQNLNKLKLNKN